MKTQINTIDIKLKLPEYWQSIPRSRRLQYLAEIVPVDFESLPQRKRVEVEARLALWAGPATGRITISDLRTVIGGNKKHGR